MTPTRALLLAFALTGCPSDDHDPTDGHTEECTDAGDTYSSGLERTDGDFTFSLTTSTDAQPDKGDNTWTVEITDGSGAAVEGATLIATPFMVAHGHGTSPPTFDSNETSPGVYEIDTMNLFMGGTWDVTLDLETTGGDQASVVYVFCVEG